MTELMDWQKYSNSKTLSMTVKLKFFLDWNFIRRKVFMVFAKCAPYSSKAKLKIDLTSYKITKTACISI